MRKYRNRIQRMTAAIAAVCTLCVLCVPARALDTCGPDHEHDGSCTLTAAPELTLHIHDEYCFDSEENVICPLPELEEHTHSDDCYEIRPLSGAGHVHTDGCYTTQRGALTCGLEGHVHSAACYKIVEPQNSHRHTDACYSRVQGDLTCTSPEFAGHSHKDSCYILSDIPVCGQAESAEHTHSTSCYGRTLVCETPETSGHTHGNGCFEWTMALSCGMAETSDADVQRILVCTAGVKPECDHGDDCKNCKSDEHLHENSCYEWKKVLSCGMSGTASAAERVLICTKPQLANHTHGEACYETDESGTEKLICDLYEMTAHQHTEACLSFAAEDLVCVLGENEEHTHTHSCYRSWSFLCAAKEEESILPEGTEPKEDEEVQSIFPEGSDPDADVESSATWKKTFAHVQLTGKWSEDLIAIAETQLGYEESTRNYILSGSGEKSGYTRYGHWYGNRYGDWCAMFASFCLHYAGIDEVPPQCKCEHWIGLLKAAGMYVYADDYNPRPGDLMFIDYSRKNATRLNTAFGADHVAIVAEIIPATHKTPAKIITIEGNYDDRVCYQIRDLDDPIIMGYGLLPDGPAAIYSCGMEKHIHESGCYDEEEDQLVCQMPEHEHKETCRTRQLQYTDGSVTVDVTLTNAVYMPENLSLRVTPVPENEADDLTAAAEDAIQENGYDADESLIYRLEILSDGKPCKLALGVNAQVEVAFAEPVLAADASERHIFMLHERKSDFETVEVITDTYESTDAGIAALRFETNRIGYVLVTSADPEETV